MIKGREGSNIFMVRCTTSNGTSTFGSDQYTVGHSYRAMLTTKDEEEKRGLWIWIENNQKTACGFGKIHFHTKFVNIIEVRQDKLKQLGI